MIERAWCGCFTKAALKVMKKALASQSGPYLSSQLFHKCCKQVKMRALYAAAPTIPGCCFPSFSQFNNIMMVCTYIFDVMVS
jgi:hypothetical protein